MECASVIFALWRVIYISFEKGLVFLCDIIYNVIK